MTSMTLDLCDFVSALMSTYPILMIKTLGFFKGILRHNVSVCLKTISHEDCHRFMVNRY